MKIRSYSFVRFSLMACAAALTLGAGVAHAQSQDQMQKLAKSGAQFAANNARVASEVCGVDASTVSNYKSNAGKKFSQDRDFAKDWDAGWQNAAQTVNGMRQMKQNNPKEFDQQKAAICGDLQQQMKS
ncbi:hypothetical protein [Paraburkholderia unamae]|uniref:Uncharacterized protein n=1 Tax=Paraburkholderia unamae TaxID=219649 RepID=A0ABX5KPM6_9BURK|nr:hypothetical protein [Paraburkholderia unamae]PVX84438.1 hypothetical protein C7402_105279 [Paraburkholderia unamae]CAG9248060.1 conserved exported hypothetical protein [Paraburkholderia unamae]